MVAKGLPGLAVARRSRLQTMVTVREECWNARDLYGRPMGQMEEGALYYHPMDTASCTTGLHPVEDMYV